MGGKFKWRNIMSVHLERRDLINTQQMEVAVRGPDGATHLVLCTGVACLDALIHESYTFLVGPKISRRQFVGVIASGALSRIQASDKNGVREGLDMELDVNLISIDANYDDASEQIKVTAEVSSTRAVAKLGISYNVSILAELPIY
jgi:hypothetical protein